jgi:hypothetical protein
MAYLADSHSSSRNNNSTRKTAERTCVGQSTTGLRRMQGRQMCSPDLAGGESMPTAEPSFVHEKRLDIAYARLGARGLFGLFLRSRFLRLRRSEPGRADLRGGPIDPFLTDGRAALRALDAIAARSGRPMRVTSLSADRMNALMVDLKTTSAWTIMSLHATVLCRGQRPLS